MKKQNVFGVYADCTLTMSKTLVWIGGDTYNHRTEIKADGFKWSGKKKMWWMTITEYQNRIENIGKGDDGYTELAGRLDYDLGY
jgi:hypothetical protein